MSIAYKHAPQFLGDVIYPDTTTANEIQAIEQGRMHANLILWGPTGTGKSTVARLLAKKLGGYGTQWCDTDYTKVVNEPKPAYAMRVKGEQVPFFTDGTKYIMLFEEFDRYPQKRDVLWNALDETDPEKVMLIITTNHISKIDAPLQSRCKVFDFPQMSLEKFMPFAMTFSNDRFRDFLGAL